MVYFPKHTGHFLKSDLFSNTVFAHINTVLFRIEDPTHPANPTDPTLVWDLWDLWDLRDKTVLGVVGLDVVKKTK